MASVHPTPVTFPELEEMPGPGFLSLGQARPGMWPGQEGAELGAGQQTASDSGEALPTAPLPWAGGGPPRGLGKEVSYLRKHPNVSKACGQDISASTFNTWLCAGTQKVMYGEDRNAPVVITGSLPWMLTSLKSWASPHEFFSKALGILPTGPGCPGTDSVQASLCPHPPGIGRQTCHQVQAQAMHLPAPRGMPAHDCQALPWGTAPTLVPGRTPALCSLPLF